MEFFVSILPELVIALVSGVVGFFYQSYRRRARPHAVLQSWGNAFAHASVVDVEDLVVNRLTESWYIHRLAATSPLSEVNRAADDAKTLLNMGPEVLSLLDYATGLLDTADSPQSVLSAAGQPMAANFFEHLLMVLLLSNEVKVQDWAPSDAKHLESYEWEERNGSYILPLPGKNLIFGKDLNIPLIKAKLAPFVGLLEGANRGGLLECYSAVRERLSSELHIAESVSPRLADLENQFAKWSGWIFLANYGLTGMFIESTAVIEIRRKRGLRLVQKMPATMVLEGLDESGEITSTRNEPVGLMLNPGEHKELGFVSDKQQNEITGGRTVRGVYEDENHVARIKFWAITAAIPRRQQVTTPWMPFRGGVQDRTAADAS